MMSESRKESFENEVCSQTLPNICKISIEPSMKGNAYEESIGTNNVMEAMHLDVNTQDDNSPFHDLWIKFDTFLKRFYHTILEGKKPPDEYDFYINIVKELVTFDPHQLFARLEVDLQEFVIELKLRQLDLLDCIHTDEGPHLFIFCLIEGYNKLMFAAYSLSPLLLQLEIEHLSRFNISWRSLNQHLFHTWVFTDPKIQKVLPNCISKLGKDNSDISDFNKRLIRQFLAFDDEMTKVGEKWREAESSIIQYHQENSILDTKWRTTAVNWNLIRNQNKIFQEELKSSGISACFDSEISFSYSDVGISEDPLKSLNGDLGNKSDSKNASLQIKTLSNSLKQMKIDLDSIQDQQFCECCQSISSEFINNQEIGLMKCKSEGKLVTKKCNKRVPCDAPFKDPDTSSYLNVDGKKLYSHMHKLKVQEMDSGATKIQRSTSANISVRDIKEMVEDTENIDASLDNSADNKLPTASELQKTQLHRNAITQQRQQHQKKIMQMMQCSQHKDIQHKIQKQLQEHQQLLQQQRKIDELYAHLLQQHVSNSEKDSSKSTHVQLQHRNSQKHKQIDEKFQQQVQQYIQQLQESPGSSSPHCPHSTTSENSAHLNTKSSNQCCDSNSRTPTVPIATVTSQTKPHAKNGISNCNTSSVITNSAAPKDSTTRTQSPSISNGDQNRKHSHPLSDIIKSAKYICPKHGDHGKTVSTSNDDTNADSYSSECSTDDEFDWERSNSPLRHCDCCYCEVFGSAPVSRSYQETRDRLRLILTKKKAKSDAGDEKVVRHGCQVNHEGLKDAKDKPRKPLEYKGDKSIEEIMDFIEGNKPNNLKREAKKMRRKQRQVEEEERRKKEMEEAERLRQEELRREEEKRKQNSKKKKKEAKQVRQVCSGKQTLSSVVPSSSKLNNKVDKKLPNGNNIVFQKQLTVLPMVKSSHLKPKNCPKSVQQESRITTKCLEKNPNDKRDHRKIKTNASSTLLSDNSRKSKQAITNKVQTFEENNGGLTSDEPQMVTIKRIVQPNCNEPTVTITLRGATPKEDKVLYTLQNGQMCPVKAEVKKKQGENPKKSNQSSKSTNEIQSFQERNKSNINIIKDAGVAPTSVSHFQGNHFNQFHPLSYSLSPTYKTNQLGVDANSNSSLPNNNYMTASLTNMTRCMENMRLNSSLSSNKSDNCTNKCSLSQTELTTPTAIQISQAVNQLSSRPSFPSNLDLENIKLPPGITITKVDPNTLPKKPLQIKQQQQPASSAAAPRSQICPSVISSPMPSSSNVIMVDTNERESSIGKRRRRRRKTKEDNEPTHNVNKLVQNSNIAPVINSYGIQQRINPTLFVNSIMSNGNCGNTQQPAPAIIQMNGSMVTIRNPALHQAYSAHNNISNQANQSPSLNGATNALENGDADEYDKELEAFKQFCSQSVPAESKAKVNLNIEDIVRKKKGSVLGY